MSDPNNKESEAPLIVNPGESISNDQVNSGDQSNPEGRQSEDNSHELQIERKSNQPIAMSELDAKQLEPLIAKHKLLVNSLITVSKRLGQENYESWRLEFEIKLRNIALMKLIEGNWSAAAQATDDFKELDRKAQDNIIINVDDYLKNFIKNEQTSKAMYAKLASHFEGSVIIRGWRLCKMLVELLEQKAKNLDQIAFDFQALVDKFNQVFPEVPDEFFISMFCALLPPQYDYILSDILSQSETKTVTCDQIIKLTMSAFTRLREKHSDDQPKLLNNCGAVISDVKSHGHLQTNGQSRDQKQPNSKHRKPKSDLMCDHCKRRGHAKDRCITYLQQQVASMNEHNQPAQTKPASSSQSLQQSSNQSSAKSNNSTAKRTTGSIHVDAVMLANTMAYDDIDPNKHYLDTGCAHDVFNNLVGASQLIQHQATVKGFNNQLSTISGMANYHLVTETNFSLCLNNVFYAPTAAASFVSYSRLDKTGKITMTGGDGKLVVKLKDNAQIMFTAQMIRAGLYEMNLRPYEVIVSAVRVHYTAPDEYIYRYWHNLLGHCDFGYIKKIAHLIGIKSSHKRLICDTCTASKATKLPFASSINRASKPFELVHSDPSGIIRIANPSGYRYFLILEDDHSRYINVFLLSRKFQVTKCLEQYKNWIRVQFNSHLVTMRSDNGTEYTSSTVNELLTQQGTAHQLTAHGNPEQNSRAERVMRTIDDMARTMMRSENVHIRFWPYAILYAVFIKNRLPHAGINFEILYFKLFDKYPKYRDLIKFGTKVFVRNQSSSTKFDDRSRVAIFLGYPHLTDGFYVYLIDRNKIDISRDVYQSEESAGGQVHLTTPNSTEPAVDDVYMSEDQSHLYLRSLYTEDGESTADDQLETQYYEEDDDEFESCESSPYSPATTDDVQDESINADNVQNESANIESSQHESTHTPVDTQLVRLMRDEMDFSNPPNEQPTGHFAMNKKERALFKECFPSAIFTYMPGHVPSKSKNEKLTNWRINAIRVPKSYIEATTGCDRSIWQEAMVNEYNSQLANRTWQLVDRPPNAKVYPMIWVYKYVYDSNGHVVKSKARLVVLGNKQIIELDEHNYAPVVHYSSIRIILSLVASNGWYAHHIDCSTAFLNASVEGEIYCYQPAGFKIKGQEHKVCKLMKAIYGLRQAARQWYLFLRRILISMGFKQILSDLCIFIKLVCDVLLIMIVYVDDLLSICSREDYIIDFKTRFKEQVKIKDYGSVTRFLGLNIQYDRVSRILHIDQIDYVSDLLQSAGFAHCNTTKYPIKISHDKASAPLDDSPIDITFYQQTVGKLIYLANLSRFDIAYAVNILCQSMHNPTKFHLTILHNLLRYLQKTKHHRLTYTNKTTGVTIYSDANFSTVNNKNSSQLGVLTFVNGNLVSWISRKQSRVVTNTCESEVLAVLDAINDAEFVANLLQDLSLDAKEEPIVVFNDNMSAKHSIHTGGDFFNNRHYRNRLNRIIMAVDDKLVQIKYVPSKENLADHLTKAVATGFDTFLAQCGLAE